MFGRNLALKILALWPEWRDKIFCKMEMGKSYYCDPFMEKVYTALLTHCWVCIMLIVPHVWNYNCRQRFRMTDWLATHVPTEKPLAVLATLLYGCYELYVLVGLKKFTSN